jgi:hypothetical protein
MNLKRLMNVRQQEQLKQHCQGHCTAAPLTDVDWLQTNQNIIHSITLTRDDSLNDTFVFKHFVKSSFTSSLIQFQLSELHVAIEIIERLDHHCRTVKTS